MAGSYGHVVDEQGRLLQPEDICGMLECSSGDVAEAVEEMYGMIWYLAERVNESPDLHIRGLPVSTWVEDARENYKEGLKISPGRRPEDEPLEDEE